MRLMVACGGTGGHIYPAIAVARAFQRTGEDEIRFVGSRRGPEARIVPAAGFPFRGVPVSGLRGKGLRARLAGLAALPVGFAAALAEVLRYRPHVVLGTGGYASAPVLAAATLARRPLVIQEQNRRLGFTNRCFARLARRAALSFPETARELGFGEVTGNPVRPEFFAAGEPPLRPGRLSVLVFGGSQGSRTLNRAVVEALPALRSWGEAIFLRHQTGPREHAEVVAAWKAAGFDRGEVLAYIDAMPEAFARADLVICRAGASTVAELCAAGRGSVLVPYPHATGDHQRENAEALVSRGAAALVDDAELDGARLIGLLEGHRADPERLRAMAAAARELARPEAAERIAGLLRRAGGKGGAG